MSIRFVYAFALLIAFTAGCASRPDIVGHNSEARQWAEAQKDEPRDKTKNWPAPRPSSGERPAAPGSAPANSAPETQPK